YGACRVGRAAPYGNGQETAQSGAGNGRDPSCDARIRIFGRTLPRDVRLIALPAGRDCVPAFCGFLRFFRPAGARMLSEKTIRPGKVGLFLLSRAAFVPFGLCLPAGSGYRVVTAASPRMAPCEP